MALWRRRQGRQDGEASDPQVTSYETFILLTGMTMSNVGMATASKTLASLPALAWCLALAYYLVAAGLGVVFSVVSSTICEQGVFTPAAAVALLVVNMVVGLVVWQDYTAIHGTWMAYWCCGCLMCCGVYLLAEVDLLERYRRHAVAQRVVAGSHHGPTHAAARYHILPTTTAPKRKTSGEEEKKQDDNDAADAWQATLMDETPWRPYRGEPLIIPI